MDNTNSHKQISHYLYGLYIKAETKNTIYEYEKNNNLKFDIIITLRIYTKLKNPIYPYYEQIKNNNEYVFVGSEELFNIYNTGSYPDAFMSSNRDIGIQILDCFDVLKKSGINNTNIFHPETTSYNVIINKGYKVYYIPNFYAFVIQ
jgi:hypothetical protein